MIVRQVAESKKWVEHAFKDGAKMLLQAGAYNVTTARVCSSAFLFDDILDRTLIDEQVV
jgi:hypothetical protein